jgi:hypothetical protein
MQQCPQHLRDAVQPGLQALVQCLAADASVCECHQQGACQFAAGSAQPRLDVECHVHGSLGMGGGAWP